MKKIKYNKINQKRATIITRKNRDLNFVDFATQNE